MNLRRKLAFFMALSRYVEMIVSGIPPLSLAKAKANSLTSLKAFGGTKENYGIPTEYTQIDYAKKKGTAGVQGKFDTGIKPTVDDVKIEMKVKIGDEAQQAGQPTVGSFYACQARVNATSDITGISGSSASGSINGMQNGQSVASGIVRVKDHIDLIRYEYKNGTHSIYVKDLTTNTEDTQTGTYTFAAPTKNLYIFGNTTTTNNLNNNNAIYYCKIWVSGSLAFDAVPVIRNSDNKVGLYDKVSQKFIEPIITEGGGFEAGDITTPTPSDPMDIYCNNGALKVLDKSQWTILTNPSSTPNQGAYIDTSGKWYVVGDRSEGCVIPLTIGKQYTLVIHKKTADLGTILRYGQSPQETPTGAGIQLTDWYRGDITDGQMISFVAKQPYFVMQLSANAVEAGMVQEAIEVIEAQGGDYTFLKYIEATGTQYIETGLSGGIRWVGAGQGTSESGGSKCILGGLATSGASVYLASRFGSSTSSSNKNWTIDGGSNSSGISGLTYVDYDITYNSIPEGSSSSSFTGTINGVSVTRTNTDEFTAWYIGAAIGSPTPTVYGFVGNIYRQQAYQNNVLVGDFMPAIRNSDNVVGMYDMVSGTFFENQGTGTFVAGTVISDGEVLKLTPSNDTAGVANLFKINNYVDTQEILTGTITHNCGILVLDGTERYLGNSTVPAKKTALDNCYTLAVPLGPRDAITSRRVMCTHFGSSDTLPLADDRQGLALLGKTENHGDTSLAYKYIVGFGAMTAYPTIADFKAFLAAQYAAGTPVIVVYPLATPQDEVAPIPQTMQTVAGDNTLDIVQAGMGGLEAEAIYKIKILKE